MLVQNTASGTQTSYPLATLDQAVLSRYVDPEGFIPFALPVGSVWSHKVERGSFTSTLNLETARDMVRQIEIAQAPRDYTYFPSQLGFDFSSGVAKMMPIQVDKYGQRQQVEPLYFDRTGWNQFSRAILPRSGGNFIEQTTYLSPVDSVKDDMRDKMVAGFRKMSANMMMAHCQCSQKPLVFRTVLKPVGKCPNTGQNITARFVRAVVSPSYAPYSNSEMLTALLDNVGNFDVYKLDMRDNGLHVRLIDAKETDGIVRTNVQYPTINGWNSETGQRRTGLGSGTVDLRCLNGMGDYRTDAEFNWYHKGSSDRIVNGVTDALTAIRTSQSNLIRQYQEALMVEIDNGFDWMEDMLSSVNGITKTTIQGVNTAMNDETNSGPHTLAGVVDGITLLAQDNSFDIWDAIDLEKVASRVMDRGLKTANSFGGKLKARERA